MTVLRRVVAGLVAAALLGVSMWLTHVAPHLEARLQDPIPNGGRAGKIVSNRVFSVRVDRVDVARSIVTHTDIVDPKKNERITTSGIFVVVYLSVRSNQRPVGLGHVRLTTHSGLHYAESGRDGLLTKNEGIFEPMLWGNASYVFEIPKDQLKGAHLIVGQSDSLNQLSAEADVDLGLDTGSADRLLAHPTDDYKLRDA
ncbi:hypothetical protein [Actinoallomurus rhizosphaericola]|uniref:hypothetical protein n=1 Tax=Actinoallomurus rhizosphaericola TaxID=2952536 RepID=UPI0020921ED8|nr:hypothetical protein [Actinoallomurus rhizosphaericola]MCO5996141.1 hypothetical protein [Actinoallomurus rhizosphaericola]